MKFLVFSLCVSLGTSQGFFGLEQYSDGSVAPVDEPVVAMAKADHLTAKFSNGGAHFPVDGYGYPIGAHLGGIQLDGPNVGGPAIVDGYSGPYNVHTPLVGYPNGAVVPNYEPDVAAAHANLYSPLASYAPEIPFRYEGPLNMNTEMVAHPNGAVVPLDEPAVAARRAEHFAAGGGQAEPIFQASPAVSQQVPLTAQAAPVVSNSPIGHVTPVVSNAQLSSPIYTGPQNLNTQLVAHPNGALVPLDEPSVVAARNEHFATVGGLAEPIINSSPMVSQVPHMFGDAAPLINDVSPFITDAFEATPQYEGPLNLNTEMVAHPNGAVVPLDEPSVAAARAQHFAYGGGQDHFPEGQGQTQPFLNASPLVNNNVDIMSHPVPAVPQAPVFTNGYQGTFNLNNQVLASNSGALLHVAAVNDGRYVY